jgi:hypothetical protein
MSLVTQQQIAQFHEEGYFLTAVVIEPSTLDAMCVEMERVFQLPHAAPLRPEHIRHPAPRLRPPIPYPWRNPRQNGSTIRRSMAGAAR